jgi:hypothetical protein
MRKLLGIGIPACLAILVAVGVFVFHPLITHAAPSAAAVAPASIVISDHHSRPMQSGQGSSAQRQKGHSTSSSTNWSGYAVTGGNGAYTDVKGSWVEPSVKCGSRQTAYSSFWVGLDGYNSNSVEQLGTDSDCSRGRPTYYGWYEMYPNPSYELSPSSYPVSPGDTLTAEVHYNGNSTYTLSESSSRGWHFSTTQSGSFTNSSAEWIAEAPSSCSYTCKVLPLANFGTVNFSSSTANGNSIGSYGSSTWVEITMTTSGGTVKAQPSGLNGSGNGFSDTWHHS